jgi:hypothetical protein
VTNLQIVNYGIRTVAQLLSSSTISKELQRIEVYIFPQSLSTSILYRFRNASEPVSRKAVSDGFHSHRHTQDKSINT